LWKTLWKTLGGGLEDKATDAFAISSVALLKEQLERS
jgi:hypothetical protein